jgi:acyl-[acyl-carrier-protein] desaturase
MPSDLHSVEDTALLAELAPRAEDLLDRHLKAGKEWFPHELVPWSRGRDFVPGEEWDPDEVKMDEGVRSALHLNLLTEDNLPHYFREINDLFGSDGVWGVWARRWTAEEGRHSIVIRDYLTVTRSIDPIALERGRMAQVSGGIVPAPGGVLQGFAYVALQELATRVAHNNTGEQMEDEAGKAVMARVARDENLHYLFYKDAVIAGIELDPSAAVIAIDAEARRFVMPGVGVPEYKRHAAAIARAGIYDFSSHYEQVLVPCVLKNWKVDKLEGLSPEAEQARERTMKHVEKLGRVARRRSEQREEMAASTA